MGQGDDLDDRKGSRPQIQERAFKVVPYIPAGQYMPKTAYRTNIKGVLRPGDPDVERREDLIGRRPAL